MENSIRSTVFRLLEIAWRRRFLLCVPILMMLPLSIAASFLVPDHYTARSLVMLQLSAASNPLTKVGETPNADRMAQIVGSLRALLTSDYVLAPVVDDSRNPPGSAKERAARIAALSKDVSLDLLGNDFLEFRLTGTFPNEVGSELRSVLTSFIKALVSPPGVDANAFLLQRLRNEATEADSDYLKLDRKLQALPRDNAEYSKLQAELASLGRSRTELQQRYEEEKVRQSGLPGNWRSVIDSPERMIIVDPPDNPVSKSNSRKYLVLAAGPFAGLALGIVLVVLSEMFDKKIRYADQMPLVGVPFLGILPALTEVRRTVRPTLPPPTGLRTLLQAANNDRGSERNFGRTRQVRGTLAATFLAGVALLVLFWSSSASGATAATPEHTIHVREGLDFQEAINAARPGDQIVLQAGATFTGSYTLPARAGEGWITIRSEGPLPAEGVRAIPTDAGGMATIRSPGAGSPALQLAPGAQNYRIIGLNIEAAPSVVQMGSLVNLGDRGSDLGTQPRNIVIDRCYIHGSDRLDLRRAISLQSARTTIVNSYISDVHSASSDSQAIAGWNGSGPYLIQNNFLEASGENVMFGGADPSVQGLVPSDITIQGNDFYKPTSWRGKWLVKNLFELKLGNRVLVQNNTFENNWVDGQAGFAILFKSSNQNGAAPWAQTTNVTFQQNVIKNSPNGVNIGAVDSTGNTAIPASNFNINNNLFYNIGDTTGGTLFQLVSGSGALANVAITNNTAILTATSPSQGMALSFDGGPTTGFVFKNNVISNGAYGVKGSGQGIGNGTLAHFAPGGSFTGNVLIGGSASAYSSYAGNYFPAAVSFVKPSVGDYRLAVNPYGAVGARSVAEKSMQGAPAQPGGP